MVIGKVRFEVSSSSVSKIYGYLFNIVFFIHDFIHRTYERVERKKSLRRLTSQWCEKVREQKLAEYRDKLNNEKEIFFKEKLESLEWIKKEEIECGAPQTITDADIEAARKQLEEWRALKSNKE
jgi:small subunit ribosomal protein S15